MEHAHARGIARGSRLDSFDERIWEKFESSMAEERPLALNPPAYLPNSYSDGRTGELVVCTDTEQCIRAGKFLRWSNTVYRPFIPLSNHRKICGQCKDFNMLHYKRFVAFRACMNTVTDKDSYFCDGCQSHVQWRSSMLKIGEKMISIVREPWSVLNYHIKCQKAINYQNQEEMDSVKFLLKHHR